MCKEPSVSLIFVMQSSISDDVKEEGYRQNFAMARDVDNCKGKGVFKVNKEASTRWKGRNIS